MTFALIISIIAAFATAYVLVRPHLAEGAPANIPTSENMTLLLEQKQRCLQILKDLELDYHTNKVSQADYKAMKLSASQDLSSILKAIDGATKP